MVRDGDLGEIRMVKVDYVQGYTAGSRQANATRGVNWHFVRRRPGCR